MTARLTGAERKMLGLDGIDADVETDAAVEFIIEARVADAERERDDALARLERHRALYRERFNSGLSNAEWHAQHCAAVPELRQLRARIESLADAWIGDPAYVHWRCGTDLRALLNEEAGQ